MSASLSLPDTAPPVAEALLKMVDMVRRLLELVESTSSDSGPSVDVGPVVEALRTCEPDVVVVTKADGDLANAAADEAMTALLRLVPIVKDKQLKREELARRGQNDFAEWMEANGIVTAGAAAIS